MPVLSPAGVPYTVLSRASDLSVRLNFDGELRSGLWHALAASNCSLQPLSTPVSSTQVACEPPGNIRIRVTGNHLNPNSIRMVLLDVRPVRSWQVHASQQRSHAPACTLVSCVRAHLQGSLPPACFKQAGLHFIAELSTAVLRFTQVAGLQPLQSVDIKPSVSAASI